MTHHENDKISIRRMSRLLVRLLSGLILLVLVWSCGTVPGLQEESVTSFIRVPFVRVLLTESAEDLKIGSEGSFAIECLRDGQQEVFYSSQPVTIQCVGYHLTVRNHQGDIVRQALDEVNIIPRGVGNRVKFDKRRYRGIMRLLPRGEVVRVINIVYMEDYLRGVVPPEIGARTEYELEAVKAQAIAARTYAMAHLKQYAGEPYDVKSSIMDQVYDGASGENKLANKAIDQTAGRVIMYQDELINAYFHSTCGGRTDDIADVWDRKDIPYLKSVDDQEACSWSKYYNWSETFTEQQLRGRIEQYLASDRGRDLRIGQITDLSIVDRTAGGRVRKLLVRTDLDVFSFQKDRIRWVIGRTSNPDLILPSDRFDLDIERDSGQNIVRVTFQGQGYGHGVGMCQCGAIGHSRNGWSCDSILTHYYTAVDIKKLY
ncbi:MAG: SpoIID/LytB domain-containing protein [candidate division Zixibacteria bacterium]|nr:SpoIID/LytB domain-containing protein [candidate division Zixibacteria bacterium]